HSEAALGPQLGIATSAQQIFRRGRWQIRHGAAHAVRIDVRHDVSGRGLVLQVVEFGESLNDVAESRMPGDIGDLLAMEPNFGTVTQTVDEALPVHPAGRRNARIAARGRLTLR